MKIVINSCCGGFGLSPEACVLLYELGCTSIATPVKEYFQREPKKLDEARAAWDAYKAGTLDRMPFILWAFSPDGEYVLCESDVARDDPLLVRVVENLGDRASGRHASLKIVDVPDGVEWEIDGYDGREKVVEKHRTWG